MSNVTGAYLALGATTVSVLAALVYAFALVAGDRVGDEYGALMFAVLLAEAGSAALAGAMVGWDALEHKELTARGRFLSMAFVLSTLISCGLILGFELLGVAVPGVIFGLSAIVLATVVARTGFS